MSPVGAARARADAGMGSRLAMAVYKTGALIARTVPGVLRPDVWGGLVFHSVMPSRRRMVARHLRRVTSFGGAQLSEASIRRAVRSAFVDYGRYWRESFRLPVVSKAELDAHMSFEGFEHLFEALEAGHGAILALPHLGSWDYGGAWLAMLGYKITVVVEAIEPPELFEWFAGIRRAVGMEVVPLGPDAVRTSLAALRAGGIVGLVTDRDIGGRGVGVKFFGEETTLPAGAAAMALRTGAAVLPSAVYSLPRGQHLAVIRPPVAPVRTGNVREDVAAMTQALASELEKLILRAPSQWHLFQPNWPSDPGYGG